MAALAKASTLPAPHATASFFSTPISVSELSRTHCSASPALCSDWRNFWSTCAWKADRSSPSTHAPKASAFVCIQSSADPARTEPSSAAPASSHSRFFTFADVSPTFASVSSSVA